MKTLIRRLRMLATVAADPRWWKFYFQRLFLRPQTRMAWARRLGRFRPEAPSAMGNPLSIELRASGFASLGSVLDLRQCKEIEEFLRSRKVHDPYRKEMAGLLPFDGRRDPKAHVLYHFPEDVLCSPHLLGLANCPDILEAAAGFLGCKPSIGYMTAWWSFPTGLGAQHAEQFHRDVDDWRFVKLFVYLTPVTSASGPHVYVKGSALSERLLEIRRYEDEEVEREFPPANRMTLTGSAGDAFLEDTFGIHKGQPVVRGHRLIFQVVYSMFSLPYGPRRPVGSWAQHGQPSFDPWVNRVYLGSV